MVAIWIHDALVCCCDDNSVATTLGKNATSELGGAHVNSWWRLVFPSSLGLESSRGYEVALHLIQSRLEWCWDWRRIALYCLSQVKKERRKWEEQTNHPEDNVVDHTQER